MPDLSLIVQTTLHCVCLFYIFGAGWALHLYPKPDDPGYKEFRALAASPQTGQVARFVHTLYIIHVHVGVLFVKPK